MKKLCFLFIFFLQLVSYSQSYDISPVELTKKIIEVNTLIFGENNLEYYNQLIVGTISAETLYGYYRGKSPLGISQISPDGWSFIQSKITKEDIELLKSIGIEHHKVKFKDLAKDHSLAVVYCSLYYKYKLRGQIPLTLDQCALAWKLHYNTFAGLGTIHDFKVKYHQYGKKYLEKYYNSVSNKILHE